MKEFIYLDNNSTTALAKRALLAMLKELKGPPSNPSSPHFWDKKPKQPYLTQEQKLLSF